jgi:hypothetical protein
MNFIKLFTVLAAMLTLSFMCVSCSKDDDDKLNNKQIEIKVFPNSQGRVSFYIEADKVNINWGDGAIEELKLSTESQLEADSRVSHTYSNQNLQTIIISGENITGLYIEEDGRYTSGHFHEIRLGNCPQLVELYCHNQKLTLLEINGTVNSLEEVYISDNSLDSNVLNNIFKALPKKNSGEKAEITIWYNPGASTSDKSIAESKGWIVSE